MKRITVSLPDELVDKVKEAAGDGQVSAYVARALAEYAQRQTLDELLAEWEAENPIPEDVKRRIDAEADALFGPVDADQRLAG